MHRKHTQIGNGTRFGQLTVIRYVDSGRYPSGQKRHLYECICDCGNASIVSACHLTKGHTTSCGCFKLCTKSRLTHGLTNTTEHRSWTSMRNRCLNPNNNAFGSYGGRGIKICKRWDRFENFLSDMGPKPGLLYSLDRKNNDKGYSKSNCRWATKEEQSNNRHHIKKYEWLNRYWTISQLARYVNVKEATLRQRLRNKWSIRDAVLKPLQGKV